ncbi:Alpha/Beta hydrolase protein [Echria macrotheca]|uniref:Alpha/Beta hydrolase protein n=1 Tax=Echria macrotheca TaxID=438768 RepID=A0AAJ0B4Q9_9PEZI|nr:Alpha/Beta hydrolase protein [Echria macrotheca]
MMGIESDPSGVRFDAHRDQRQDTTARRRDLLVAIRDRAGFTPVLIRNINKLPLLSGRDIVNLELAKVYTSDFNSSFALNPSHIKGSELDVDLAQSIDNVINFDRSQLAFGGPDEDEFYTLPPLINSTAFGPGEPLKVQEYTDSTAYAIPSSLALSRFLYTTKNFNGTIVPASGYILWPYVAANLGTKAPVVVWAHGTSGFFRPQAPSAHRALGYGYSAPFSLAQAGYAVVAPDYAGLGIDKSWDGTKILHQYHASPAGARDVLYGMRAARTLFPNELDSRFVVMGHSQGGGVAWAVAEALAGHDENSEFGDLVSGYRGAIAASPTTDVFSGPPSFMLPTVGLNLDSIFPDFNLSYWLTDIGVKRTQLAREVKGSIGVIGQLLQTRNDTYRTDYNSSWYASAFSRLGDAGRKNIKGPLLVVQGTDDHVVPYNVTSKTVDDTWKKYPDCDLEFLVISGAGHVPSLDASKHVWLDWIRDRMHDQPLKKPGATTTVLKSLVPIGRYLSTINAIPLWAGLPQFSFQVVPLNI